MAVKELMEDLAAANQHATMAEMTFASESEKLRIDREKMEAERHRLELELERATEDIGSREQVGAPVTKPERPETTLALVLNRVLAKLRPLHRR